MDDSSICAVTLNDDCSNTNRRDKVFLKRITDDDNTNKIIIIFYNIIL